MELAQRSAVLLPPLGAALVAAHPTDWIVEAELEGVLLHLLRVSAGDVPASGRREDGLSDENAAEAEKERLHRR